MGLVTQVNELIGYMTENERQECLELFTKQETEDERLKKDIVSNIEELKAGFAELTMDDWDEFCKHLNYFSRVIKETRGMIDWRRQLDEQARSAKRQEYIQGMLDQGFKFDRIKIEGEDFDVVGGKPQPQPGGTGVPDDQIQF